MKKWLEYSVFGLFSNGKTCGLGPRAMDLDRGFGPPWTTWRRRLEATVVRHRAHQTLASGRFGARKLTGEGRARRGEDDGGGAVLTWAREAA
jgi:hypothetical protein